MSGTVFAWVVAGLVGVSMLALLAIATLLLPRSVRLLRSRTYCPWAARSVEVRTLALDGIEPVSVTSCTAFADPAMVTCGMPCIGGDHREMLAGDRWSTALPAR
jgi:hypothetical protein